MTGTRAKRVDTSAVSTDGPAATPPPSTVDDGARGDAPRAHGWHRLAGRLTSRLQLRTRLILLVAALMVPTVVAVWSFAGAVGASIAFSAAERDGLVVLEPALQALASTAGGQDVDLAALRSAVDAEPSLALDDSMSKAEALVPAATDPAGRAALAQALAALVTEAGNSSNLILDPDLDSFYVMDLLVVQVPKALVTAAQTAVEPAGGPNEKVAAHALLAGSLAAAAGSFSSDVQTSLSTTSSTALRSQLAEVAAAATSVTALSDALTAGLASPTAQDPSAAAAAVAAAVPSACAGLDALLTTRIAGMTDKRLSTLVLTAVAALVALAWALAVVTSTRDDVDTALRGIEAIAAGDLTAKPVPTGRDEVGDIGRAIQRARTSLAGVVSRLLEASGQVAGSAERLSRSAQAVDSSANQTLALSRAASSEVETVTAMIGEVSTATQQVTTASGEIASTMTEVNATAARALDDLSHAVALTSALGESSRTIESTVEAIAAVAAKTRMLALNATIEAALAGEAGKGFGVVADEVKNLAQASSGASSDIGQVAGTQHGQIDEVLAAIDRAHQAMDVATQSQGTVTAATEEQRVTMTDVAGSLSATAAATARISEGIAQVEDVAVGTTREADALTEAARSMADVARQLAVQVGAFQVA